MVSKSSDDNIESILKLSASFPPLKRNINQMQVREKDSYKDFYRSSIKNSSDFWGDVASEMQWFKKWDKLIDGSFPDFKFFVNGYSNVSLNCIDRYANKTPGKDAIIWLNERGESRRVTYSELRDQTGKFASAMTMIGIKKGDVVAIFLPNVIEAFIAVHACYRIGAIYNIIFSGFSANALKERLIDTEPKIIITAENTIRKGKIIELKEKIDSVIADIPSIENVIVVAGYDKNRRQIGKKDIFFDTFINKAENSLEPLPIEANAPGFIIYTSGTTSKPKGIVHSGIGFLIGSYNNVKYALDLGMGDVYWCTADVGWLTFPIFELVGGLAHGATVIAYEGALDYPSIDHFYKIIEKYNVTKLFTAPTFLRMLARDGETTAKKYNISSLKLVSLVGEPLDIKTWFWVHKNIGDGNIEINNTYGQTETGSAWTSSIVGVTDARPGSCGLPLPGHSFSILDDNGKPLPPNKIGTLVLTEPFPGLARDIWKNHDRFIREYFSIFPNSYCTYDQAVEDSFGHIWVLGRTDDVINVSGHRISTMEMENAVMSVPGVSEAAVIGIEDALTGTTPVVFVSIDKKFNSDINTIKAMVRDSIIAGIGSFAKPSSIFIVSFMPKTRSGKIMRRLLREILVKQSVSGDITGLEDPEIINKLISELHKPE